MGRATMTAVPRPGSRIGLVGRGTERAGLLAALDRARSGRAAAVLLSGDAGVGKSRLVAELAETAGDAHVVVGRCLDIGDASEAGGSAGMEKFLRDHATGAVPEVYYDRYTQESIDHLRAALAESPSTV